MSLHHPDCDGKEAYDKKAAMTAINYHKKHFGRILRCYQCPSCNHYHLTHKEKYSEQEKLWKKWNARLAKEKPKVSLNYDDDSASTADIF